MEREGKDDEFVVLVWLDAKALPMLTRAVKDNAMDSRGCVARLDLFVNPDTGRQEIGVRIARAKPMTTQLRR
jgi:hypothetical protein